VRDLEIRVGESGVESEKEEIKKYVCDNTILYYLK